MRDYRSIDRYLDELAGDVYSQPEDNGHTKMVEEVFNLWIAGLPLEKVLDVGCGAEQVVRQFFYKLNISYWGISLGDDARGAIEMDMSFLLFPDSVFDLVWCRHTLEHSPMPLLTLMEFHRVSRNYLCLIVPNPGHYGYVGRNHYSVTNPQGIIWLLRRAGWKPIRVQLTDQEFRFLCHKKPRISYEGYAPAPLPNDVYQFERDLAVDGRDIDVEKEMTKDEKDGDV